MMLKSTPRKYSKMAPQPNASLFTAMNGTEEGATKIVVFIEHISLSSSLLAGNALPQCSIKVEKQIQLMPTVNSAPTSDGHTIYRFASEKMTFFSNKEDPENIEVEISVHPAVVKLATTSVACCTLTFQNASLSTDPSSSTVPLTRYNQTVGYITFRIEYLIEDYFDDSASDDDSQACCTPSPMRLSTATTPVTPGVLATPITHSGAKKRRYRSLGTPLTGIRERNERSSERRGVQEKDKILRREQHDRPLGTSSSVVTPLHTHTHPRHGTPHTTHHHTSTNEVTESLLTPKPLLVSPPDTPEVNLTPGVPCTPCTMSTTTEASPAAGYSTSKADGILISHSDNEHIDSTDPAHGLESFTGSVRELASQTGETPAQPCTEEPPVSDNAHEEYIASASVHNHTVTTTEEHMFISHQLPSQNSELDSANVDSENEESDVSDELPASPVSSTSSTSSMGTQCNDASPVMQSPVNTATSASTKSHSPHSKTHAYRNEDQRKANQGEYNGAACYTYTQPKGKHSPASASPNGKNFFVDSLKSTPMNTHSTSTSTGHSNPREDDEDNPSVIAAALKQKHMKIMKQSTKHRRGFVPIKMVFFLAFVLVVVWLQNAGWDPDVDVDYMRHLVTSYLEGKSQSHPLAVNLDVNAMKEKFRDHKEHLEDQFLLGKVLRQYSNSGDNDVDDFTDVLEVRGGADPGMFPRETADTDMFIDLDIDVKSSSSAAGATGDRDDDGNVIDVVGRRQRRRKLEQHRKQPLVSPTSSATTSTSTLRNTLNTYPTHSTDRKGAPSSVVSADMEPTKSMALEGAAPLISTTDTVSLAGLDTPVHVKDTTKVVQDSDVMETLTVMHYRHQGSALSTNTADHPIHPTGEGNRIQIVDPEDLACLTYRRGLLFGGEVMFSTNCDHNPDSWWRVFYTNIAYPIPKPLLKNHTNAGHEMIAATTSLVHLQIQHDGSRSHQCLCPINCNVQQRNSTRLVLRSCGKCPNCPSGWTMDSTAVDVMRSLSSVSYHAGAGDIPLMWSTMVSNTMPLQLQNSSSGGTSSAKETLTAIPPASRKNNSTRNTRSSAGANHTHTGTGTSLQMSCLARFGPSRATANVQTCSSMNVVPWLLVRSEVATRSTDGQDNAVLTVESREFKSMKPLQ